jgi:hypothetical protein
LTTRHRDTYETVVLNVLAYEFRREDEDASATLIAKRLKRKKLGAYDEGRVAALRALRRDLGAEIGRYGKSAYYAGSHGKYADIEDFDVARLSRDMIERHPTVPADIVEPFTRFAVFLYYLR